MRLKNNYKNKGLWTGHPLKKGVEPPHPKLRGYGFPGKFKERPLQKSEGNSCEKHFAAVFLGPFPGITWKRQMRGQRHPLKESRFWDAKLALAHGKRRLESETEREVLLKDASRPEQPRQLTIDAGHSPADKWEQS